MTDEELDPKALRMLIKKLTFNINQLKSQLKELNETYAFRVSRIGSPNDCGAANMGAERAYSKIKPIEIKINKYQNRIKKLEAYLKLETELKDHEKLL